MSDESDFVYVEALKYDTKRAWGLDNTYLSQVDAAWLFFRLRETPDTSEVFPHGKWASIQHLEELIREQAGKALVEYGDPL